MRIILIIILLFISIRLMAPEVKTLVIVKAKNINPYTRILKACIEVESEGNMFAYNPRENAVGILQIRPIKLEQYFIETGVRYSLKDCFNPAISKRIFLHFACQFRADDYKAISKDWNKSKTDVYWNKVKSKL